MSIDYLVLRSLPIVFLRSGELHSDEESVLLDQGSRQNHLWGEAHCISISPTRIGSNLIP